MKKLFTIILNIFLFISISQAQDKYKFWEEGKLTWDDFQGRASEGAISELKYILSYRLSKQKSNDTIVRRVEAIAVMIKNKSGVTPGFENEQILRYNQVIFDLLEVHRRRLQDQLDRGYSSRDLEKTWKEIESSCIKEIDSFQRDSKYGQDLNIITLWEKIASINLEKKPDPIVPNFRKSNFGYGIHAGMAAGFFSGSLSKYLSPSYYFIFGFDIAFKNYSLFLNGSLGRSELQKNLNLERNWEEGKKVGVVIVEASLGYSFLNNGKIKVTPFGGLGITQFELDDKDDVNGLIGDYNYLVGVNADFKVRKRIIIYPNLYKTKEISEFSIRTRIYVSKANIFPNFKGHTINLSIGLSGFANFIKLKE